MKSWNSIQSFSVYCVFSIPFRIKVTEKKIPHPKEAVQQSFGYAEKDISERCIFSNIPCDF